VTRDGRHTSRVMRIVFVSAGVVGGAADGAYAVT
jgi:hypothetical protein